MIHMYGIHRMREKNVMRYSSAVLRSLPRGLYRAGLQPISVLFLLRKGCVCSGRYL